MSNLSSECPKGDSVAPQKDGTEQALSNSHSNNDTSALNRMISLDSSNNLTAENAGKDKSKHKSRSDFTFIRELGEGSFSTVHLAKEKSTDREFAVKECFKKQIIRERKVQQIYREREAMAILSKKENYHPFIVNIYCTFQDRESLYIVMTLAKGGELLHKLKKCKKFDIPTTRFYTSEIVSALECIHSHNIIHRDLKPENILLSESGHILISDFGSACILGVKTPEPEEEETDESHRRRKRLVSFVGTAQYVSPEVLNGQAVEQACDYWALGVIMYQFLTGKHAFHDESEYLIYRKILNAQYDLPKDIPAQASDLIQRLLVVDMASRLGSIKMGGADAVKQHRFFEEVDWANLENVKPPQLDVS
ncbi:unnamed protein product [Anisakis simplex]|uniref:non-specific serine/threonine protein kinase n=1 Tax=Anisakis simplex TaxID=6269 RepID=A0A0M3K0W9_ANISI|nr:unnamed protein product [Anisakis simplex]